MPSRLRSERGTSVDLCSKPTCCAATDQVLVIQVLTSDQRIVRSLSEEVLHPRVCSQLLPPGVVGPLHLTVYRMDGKQVIEGILEANSGAWFPIVDGVPSFLSGPLRPDLRDFCSRHHLPLPVERPSSLNFSDQAKTTRTFSDKWRRFKNYGIEPQHKEFLFGWYCKKFGLPDQDALAAFYRDRRRVLEVGPGSGFNTRFIAEHCGGQVFALDVSDAAYTAYENTFDLENCNVVQADLMEAPFADEFFDFVIADGVLHHTPGYPRRGRGAIS